MQLLNVIQIPDKKVIIDIKITKNKLIEYAFNKFNFNNIISDEITKFSKNYYKLNEDFFKKYNIDGIEIYCDIGEDLEESEEDSEANHTNNSVDDYRFLLFIKYYFNSHTSENVQKIMCNDDCDEFGFHYLTRDGSDDVNYQYIGDQANRVMNILYKINYNYFRNTFDYDNRQMVRKNIIKCLNNSKLTFPIMFSINCILPGSTESVINNNDERSII